MSTTAWTRAQPGSSAPKWRHALRAELVGQAVAAGQQVDQRVVGQGRNRDLRRARCDRIGRAGHEHLRLVAQRRLTLGERQPLATVAEGVEVLVAAGRRRARLPVGVDHPLLLEHGRPVVEAGRDLHDDGHVGLAAQGEATADAHPAELGVSQRHGSDGSKP